LLSTTSPLAIELDGFHMTEPLSSQDQPSAPRDDDATRPQPGSLGAETRDIFVGRTHELTILREALAAVARHRTTVVLLSGEPGIGKTRLASEAGAIAARHGFHVHWGRCWEAGGAPAYWPWIEVIRSCVRAADATRLPQRLPTQAAHLALLVPELRERFPDMPEPEVTADPDRARFHLFDGIASFLRAFAEVQPLVIVLDDLHAADHSSAVMLQFLAHQLRDVPMVLVGCYRDTEIRAASEVGDVLAAVARNGQHVALHGLPERDVELFVHALWPRADFPAIASTVRDVTGGNPFFVGELLSTLATGSELGGKMPLPDGVRGAVRSRLRRLSQGCIDLLTLASVFGQEFGLRELAATADRSTDDVATTLEEAIDARLIAERAGALGHYLFVHGLIREVLYEDLPAGKRAELHERVGGALERLRGADGETHLDTLAHHFFMASTHGDTEKAIVFCTQAADRALRQLAAPEAVEQYGRALQVLSLTPGDTLRRRSDLLLGRGRALERLGDFESAHRDFTEAATIARRIDDPERFAQAALGCGEQWALKFTCSIVDKSDLGLLEEALRITPPERRSLRASLLARTGSAQFYAGALARGQELSVAAVDVARQIGEHDVLARVLSARHAVLLGPDDVAERFGVLEEIEKLAEASGNREVRLRGHVLRFFDLVEIGDVEDAELEAAKIMRLVDEIGDPFEQWHCTMAQAGAALFHGRLAEGERLAREANDAAQRVPGQQRDDQNAMQCFLIQTVFLRREQGRLDELSDDAWSMVDEFSHVTIWRAAAALMELDLGRTHSATTRVDHIGARTLSLIPRDSIWSGTMFLLAEVFARLRDPVRCRHVLDLLSPYPELNATVASPVWLGSTTRALGLLTAALERWDESAAFFEHALEWHARRGARLWLGHTQVDYAAMLAERRRTGDRQRAVALLESAADAAATLDAGRLAARVGELERRLAAPRESDPAATTPAPRGSRHPNQPVRARFQREGEYWTISDGETTARLKHSRGLAMLAFLLARPGREIHAVELVLVANPPPPSALSTGRVEHGSGIPAAQRERTEHDLDPQARGAYRERLADLRSEVEEARAHNDLHRVARAEIEIEQLTAELKRDLGFGHGRRSGTRAERARLNVTRAIRSAIVRLEDAHPLLGEHFRLSVRTGTFCVYAPDPIARIRWEP